MLRIPGGGSISVIDGKRDAVIATVKGEAQPYVLAVNDVTNKVYVTNTYNDVVTVIDGETNTARALKVGQRRWDRRRSSQQYRVSDDLRGP